MYRVYTKSNLGRKYQICPEFPILKSLEYIAELWWKTNLFLELCDPPSTLSLEEKISDFSKPENFCLL